jgi:hypothetical protein
MKWVTPLLAVITNCSLGILSKHFIPLSGLEKDRNLLVRVTSENKQMERGGKEE